MNIPPDDNGPPPSGLGFDPSLSGAMTGDISLTGQNKSKTPLLIVGVLAVAGIGGYVWHAKKVRDERVQHVRFLEEFQAFEKDDLGKFWLCALGPNVDGTSLNDPSQITMKVDQQFASDYKAYPVKVQDDCVKAAKDAKEKVSSMAALPAYSGALEGYGKSITDMADALAEWGKTAPAQIQAKMVSRNLEEYSTAWHSFAGGAPAPEVAAFDQFLHCAVPDVDTKYKDDIALATFIFESCKQPTYPEKLQEECGKLLTDKTGTVTKGFKAAVQKFAGEDPADQKAFSSCLRKSRKGKMKGELMPVGEKWIAFRTAREAVLKLGQEALKE